MSVGFRIVVLTAVGACLSGCFSAGARWWGAQPSAAEASAAAVAVADVATMPIQAVFLIPFLAGDTLSTARSNAGAARMAKKIDAGLQEIKGDPTIVIRKRWHLSADDVRQAIVVQSFQDQTIPYTSGLLHQILQECDRADTRVGDYVCYHHACSTDFLVEQYPRALEKGRSNPTRLIGIVSNPNTPVSLVLPVAKSKNLPARAVRAAQKRLTDSSQ